MLGSMKRQFVELLSDIGFIQERLTSRDIERMASHGSDGVMGATGHAVSGVCVCCLVACMYEIRHSLACKCETAHIRTCRS